MSTAPRSLPKLRQQPDTLADLIHQLGDIPAERIRFHPYPGTAREKDVLAALEAPRKRICELIDGVLVEKAVGTKEGCLAALIIQCLLNYLDKNDLGVVVGADGPLRLKLGLVRIPDVSFISWNRIPGDSFPDDPIARLIPDLAIEVWSVGNTKKEMERKRKEYFDAGVRLLWVIYPRTQNAEVFTSFTEMRKVSKNGNLDGDEVLPGFRLSLKQLFARANRRRPRS